MGGSTIDFVLSIFMVLGGLGLFLYGMKMMSDGLEKMAGDRMRTVLERTTSNRFLGIALGAGVTAIIQSSSATTVMVVGFVNAGMMNLIQAIGVIMGANIGTTITAQIISFRLDTYAPLIIFIGLMMNMAFKKSKIKNLGYAILGFGVLFFGISVMGEPLKEFSADPGFQAILTAFDNPFLAMIVGMLFTAVVQSSSATTGIIIAMYLGGVALPFETAVYLVMGSNVGTCITAILASLAANREAKRAALAHVIFNVAGCVLVGALITIFPGILTWIQDTFHDPARQVAMFHTLFKVTMVVVMVWFVPQLAALVNKILPERPSETAVAKRLLYLDSTIMHMPSIARVQAHREILRMANIALDNLKLALEAFFKNDPDKAATALEVEETVDFLNHQITAWLVRLRGLKLNTPDVEKLGMMLHTVSDIERIGDHAENIAEYVMLRDQSEVAISDAAMKELREIGDAVVQAVTLAVEIFESNDEARLGEVDSLEHRIDGLARECVENHIQRLKDELCDPYGGVIFTDMVADLERCGDHATNISYSILGETIWDERRQKLLRVGDALG
ncbi:MAG: Na/Pi cotransporter family protein [Clostridiales bacterium]|nr:Na/Pi cotransporter family protein [Clostridiales bacterium]